MKHLLRISHKKYFETIPWYTYTFIILDERANLPLSKMGRLASLYRKPSILAECLMLGEARSQSGLLHGIILSVESKMAEVLRAFQKFLETLA